MKTCLVCLVVGHKWTITSFNEKMVPMPDGTLACYKKRESHHVSVPFCVRCGTENPNDPFVLPMPKTEEIR